MPELNYLAVVAAAAAAFALGGAWYSPALFARAWMSAHGYSPERIAAMKRNRSPAQAMTVAAFCQLVMSLVLAILIAWTGMSGVVGGLGLGLMIGVGFAVTLSLLSTMFSDRRLMTVVIDAGYQVAGLAVMGAILGLWN